MSDPATQADRDELRSLKAKLAEQERIDRVRLDQIKSLQDLISGDLTPAGIEVARYRADVARLRSKLDRLVRAVEEYRTYAFKGGRTTAEILNEAIEAAKEVAP